MPRNDSIASRTSAATKVVALWSKRITELEAMKRVLMEWAVHWHGDDRPECPILDGLAADAKIASQAAHRLEDIDANQR